MYENNYPNHENTYYYEIIQTTTLIIMSREGTTAADFTMKAVVREMPGVRINPAKPGWGLERK